MAYRIFRDSRGTEWQTWDVVPRLEERRVNDRRAPAGVPLQSNRRLRLDRRVRSGPRPEFTSGLGAGWLCFTAADEDKRRLSPIPEDWQRCPSPRLEQYCAEATPARRVATEMRMPDTRR